MKNRVESPIFVKTHDLILWMIPALSKFPKEQRFRLALRLENALFDFHNALLQAATEKNDPPLKTADIELRKIQSYLRLSQELHFMSFTQYEHAVRLLVEVGKLLGGWIKRQATPVN